MVAQVETQEVTKVSAPSQSAFYNDNFLPGSASGYANLEMLGTELIASAPELSDLKDVRIAYFWVKKTPTSGGKEVWAKCQKLSGLAQFALDADFVILVSAEPARRLTPHQLEALMHHELLHIEVTEDDKGDTKFSVRGHDAEMFLDNIERYGLWQTDLKRAGRTFSQQPIPFTSDDGKD